MQQPDRYPRRKHHRNQPSVDGFLFVPSSGPGGPDCGPEGLDRVPAVVRARVSALGDYRRRHRGRRIHCPAWSGRQMVVFHGRADPRSAGPHPRRHRDPAGHHRAKAIRADASRSTRRGVPGPQPGRTNQSASGAGGGEGQPDGARGRLGQPGQERIPGQHEPRNPHADECRDRIRRLAGRRAVDRSPVGLRPDDWVLGATFTFNHQRYPRLFQDRGRQADHGSPRLLAG